MTNSIPTPELRQENNEIIFADYYGSTGKKEDIIIEIRSAEKSAYPT